MLNFFKLKKTKFIDIKNNRGSTIITSPLIIAIGIMMVSTLLVFCTSILSPYIWYEKLSSTCLKYVFVMEEYGYLTPKEKSSLLSDLEEQGFESSNIILNCTSKRQSYGDPIYLKVNYTYKLNLPIIGEKIIPMTISRESVSKR